MVCLNVIVHSPTVLPKIIIGKTACNLKTGDSSSKKNPRAGYVPGNSNRLEIVVIHKTIHFEQLFSCKRLFADKVRSKHVHFVKLYIAENWVPP